MSLHGSNQLVAKYGAADSNNQDTLRNNSITGSRNNSSNNDCHNCEQKMNNDTNNDEVMLSKQRKELFGDCALIEIIHLHDCLRGALRALEQDVLLLAASAEVEGDDVEELNTRQEANNGMEECPTFQQDTVSGASVPTICKLNASNSNSSIAATMELEGRVSGRFKVIWSVFKSHSHAEDEFIWPALKEKTDGRIGHSNHHEAINHPHRSIINDINHNNHVEIVGGDAGVFERIQQPHLAAVPAVVIQPVGQQNVVNHQQEQLPQQQQPVLIEQEEYEEDHADEERMFSQMDQLLSNIHEVLGDQPRNKTSITRLLKTLVENTRKLSQHLMTHLQKEETQCMPLVVEHLSKDEIHELVGKIMGQRSADTIAQIMTMAVQNLNPTDRREMVKYMKQSMAGTFFDRWLLMSGWMNDINSVTADERSENRANRNQEDEDECKMSASLNPDSIESVSASLTPNDLENSAGMDSSTQGNENENDTRSYALKRSRSNSHDSRHVCHAVRPRPTIDEEGSPDSGLTSGVTSQTELEKLIRAIATNPSLNPLQKNTTIQGLRDSIWKSNQRYKEMRDLPPTIVNQGDSTMPIPFQQQQQQQQQVLSRNVGDLTSTSNGVSGRSRRVAPPSAYFVKNRDGKVQLVWSSRPRCPSHAARSASPARGHVTETSMAAVKRQESCDYSSTDPIGNDMYSIDDADLPMFSASELAPTYHDGAAGTVLGCPHYARACKVRHPKSGRLYTCLICCEQQRELPNGERDDTLDRYAVTEVMCMKCNALQPADDRCVNPDCESIGIPFAKYFCNICHLYDGGTRPIFHCPYCNICRLGLGLGIDYRHCMRCNACVSLADKEHRCIPQKLQGNCPICREELFLSTDPLRGLKCGHVMHLSCFTEYRRGMSYTCPLCMRSMEDMTEYFALLDAAIRMQPMPSNYLNTLSNIYCQDCNQTCRVPYHFIGKKCTHCGSYNTRELGRVQMTPQSQSTTEPLLHFG